MKYLVIVEAYCDTREEAEALEAALEDFINKSNAEFNMSEIEEE